MSLICVALSVVGAFVYFYVTMPRQLRVDQTTLCPTNGPQGVIVVLFDTSDELPYPARQEVSGIIDDIITTLPPYFMLDFRALDAAGLRSVSLFSKCNPGDGAGLSEWTANPALARKRWIEAFENPARDALKRGLAPGVEKTSPIMGAIQDVALNRFSGAAVKDVPKDLIVISDMIEHTGDYSQYPAHGDLSYERYRRSPAYQKFRTDLHGASVRIKYVRRTTVKIDSREHVKFWVKWITDNMGQFGEAKALQGAG